jgi:hypothetical protein
MITCSECNAHNSDENKFCGQCASPLPAQVIVDEPQDPLAEDEPAAAEEPAKEEVDEEALVKAAFNYQPIIKLLKVSLITICVTALLLLAAHLAAEFGTDKTTVNIGEAVAPLILVGSGMAKTVLAIMLLARFWQNAEMLEVVRPSACKNLKAIFWLRLLTAVGMNLSVLSGVSAWVWLGIELLLFILRDWTIARKFPSRVALWQMAVTVTVEVLATFGFA